MPQARQIIFDTVDLVANTEKEFAFPAGTSFFEAAARTPEEFRISQTAGQTADGKKFKTIRKNVDWWTKENVKFPDAHKMYFRCSINNTIEITIYVR